MRFPSYTCDFLVLVQMLQALMGQEPGLDGYQNLDMSVLSHAFQKSADFQMVDNSNPDCRQSSRYIVDPPQYFPMPSGLSGL